MTSSRLRKFLICSNGHLHFKPGKDGTDPAHYRSISLLSVVYKLFKRLTLQRIQPLIEDVTPINQAGFRQHRTCTEQVTHDAHQS
jgi:hypothetical protein